MLGEGGVGIVLLRKTSRVVASNKMTTSTLAHLMVHLCQI